MTRIQRLGALALLPFGLLLACHRSAVSEDTLRTVTAQQTGCLAQSVEIRSKQTKSRPCTGTAVCDGRTFVCSSVDRGQCTPADTLQNRRESYPPPQGSPCLGAPDGHSCGRPFALVLLPPDAPAMRVRGGA